MLKKTNNKLQDLTVNKFNMKSLRLNTGMNKNNTN